MSKNSIQTKRGSGKKSGLKVLHAKTTGRRKQRAVAASPADLGADVPNVGIGRALIVILVLHVVAIGAVIMHTSWTEGQGGGFSGKTPMVVLDPSDGETEEPINEKKDKQLAVEKNSLPNSEANVAVKEDIPVAVVHSVRPTQVIEAAQVEEPVVKAVIVKPVSSNQSVFEYTVNQGDTIWGISNKHGMSVAKFKEMNNLSKDIIKPGQKLIVTK